MKEKSKFVNNPDSWISPSVIASINIDPTRYSHLLVYEKYCQVVVGQLTSPSLNKSDAAVIINELKNLTCTQGVVKSKLPGIKYTPTSIRIGGCILNSKNGYNCFIDALESYINDDFYNKNNILDNEFKNDGEIIFKERIGTVNLFAWWDFKRYSFGSTHMQLTIVGPYEIFTYGFTDETFITRLSDAVTCLIETKTKEVKIEDTICFKRESNLRAFKQVISGEPAICISTDVILPNQKSLILIGKESGTRFLEFLKKAQEMAKK